MFVRHAALGKTVIGRAKKKIGPSRLMAYLNHLSPFIRFLGKDLDQVDQADIEAKTSALAAAAQKLGEAAYAEQQPGTQEAGAKPGAGAQDHGDDVVDAEFTEVKDKK